MEKMVKFRFAIDSNNVSAVILTDNLYEYVMKNYRKMFLEFALSDLGSYCDTFPYDGMSDEEVWLSLDEDIKRQVLRVSFPSFVEEYFSVYELDTNTKGIVYVKNLDSDKEFDDL